MTGVNSKLNVMANDIAHRLMGTCDTIEDAFEELGYEADRDNQSLLDLIDQQVFECQSCSWWCCISEMVDGDYVCQDCS